ncbi:MAG: FAD-dependent oxidoreductase [Candidatus Hydrogenedentes bacterium]|nr:FAD-dependent oxidoreductase [Candidatus Hydrogenedentota bacterium]
MFQRFLSWTLPGLLGCLSMIGAGAATAGAQPALVVAGGTPGGIAAALAAARLGHQTALVEYYPQLGGMSASGLGKSDIETAGAIGGLWDEFAARILAHYVARYGAGSPQVEACRQGYFYEPSVAERVFEEMIAAEPRIAVYRNHQLDAVVRQGNRVQAIRIRDRSSGAALELAGEFFIDATYEGDLAAWAGLPCRLGRESRAEFDEAHAGVIYMDHKTRAFLPGSTGAGDDRLVAYTYRLCLSSSPANRIYPEQPEDYDPARYRHYLLDLKLGRIDSVVRALSIAPLPNEKYDVNMKPWPLGFPFAEENTGYPEGNWEEREAIMRRIRNLTLGLLYWLQHDPSVPPEQRQEALRYGLAADEFTGNGHFPFQCYVREARRIVGDYTLTERDLTYAPGQLRAPLHHDAIGSGEFPIDSFPTRKYEPGHEDALEGYILMLDRYTQPYQIPYRVMVSRKLENLLFPVPVSATHIAFSSVRLEPTWMSLGQAAGTAAHLAMAAKLPAAEVDVLRLQEALTDAGAVLAYFNDLPKTSPHFAAIQFWGTKGFFDRYEARAQEALTEQELAEWIGIVAETLDLEAVKAPAMTGASGVTARRFKKILDEAMPGRPNTPALPPGARPGGILQRDEVCGYFYACAKAWRTAPQSPGA